MQTTGVNPIYHFRATARALCEKRSNIEFDDDDFEPDLNQKTGQIGFSDEDVSDDDTKLDWDADSADEEESEGSPKPASTTTTTAPAKKKSLKQLLKEKERAEGATPAAAKAEVVIVEGPLKKKAGGEFAELVPSTPEEFTALAKLVAKRLSSLEESPFYAFTVEGILRELSESLSVDAIKKIGLMLNTLVNSKQAQEKAAEKPSKKGGKKKAVLKMENKNQKIAAFDDGDGDYDDFM